MSPWAILGLERTEDVAGIRRAYARKLKGIDVDSDPDSFIALRDALEEALYQARWGDDEDLDLVGEGELRPGELAVESLPSAAPIHLSDPSMAVSEPAAEEWSERFAVLDRLLFAGDDAPPPDPDELAVAVRAILDDPAMAQVDHAARTEDWLAAALYDSVPRSDPVLPMVINHFRWSETEGRIDQLWCADELIARRRAFLLLDRLADPNHELHTAYLDLTSDKPELGWATMFRSSQVDRLLTNIRERAPAAEDYLSPHRVALWDKRLGRSVGGGLRWAIFLFWSLYILSKVISAAPDTTSPNAGGVYEWRGTFTSPGADLNPLLAEIAGSRLSMDRLRGRNTDLHRRLTALWQAGSNNPQVGAPTFASDVRNIIEETARAGLREGGYSLQVRYWRLQTDELIWLRSVDAELCDSAIRGEPVTLTPPEGFGTRRREILYSALAEATGSEVPRAQESPPRFPIPASLFAEVARRSGLDRDALEGALNERGTPAQNCSARIALLNAVLEQPESDSAPLLREMSRGL